MRDQPRRNLPTKRDPGFFQDLTLRLRLVLRLMADRRVSPLLKLLPIASLVYLIVPDLAPGPIDDALVVWLGATVFVELCPPEIVREHMQAMTSVIEGEWKEVEPREGQDEGTGGPPPA
jgi:hypothetical protein